MRGNFLQEKSVNPRSWKPAGMEGLLWMKGLPMASLGSCLWTSALWRSSPRWVRKVTQQMSHLREERTGCEERARFHPSPGLLVFSVASFQRSKIKRIRHQEAGQLEVSNKNSSLREKKKGSTNLWVSGLCRGYKCERRPEREPGPLGLPCIMNKEQTLAPPQLRGCCSSETLIR